MTPGINCVKKANIPYQIHEYQHEASSTSYGLEAAEKLNLPCNQVFKTLVAKIDAAALVVAILPVDSKLSMKRLAKVCGGKKAEMADKLDVQRSTGYVLGGVSPLGQKKRLKTLIDESAKSFSTIYVSAGRRGLEIELSATDLQYLTCAEFTAICQL